MTKRHSEILEFIQKSKINSTKANNINYMFGEAAIVFKIPNIILARQFLSKRRSEFSSVKNNVLKAR